MESTQVVLAEQATHDIGALAAHIERHIAQNWQRLLETKHDKLLDAYHRVGEMAYGAYLEWLFRPLHKQAKQAGLSLSPRFPGDFNISREWGEEEDRQRWMWSTVSARDGAALGTIVVKVFHDHTQFRLPRPVEVIALTETGKDAVVEALAQRSTDFAQAKEASIEIAEYLQSLAEAEQAG